MVETYNLADLNVVDEDFITLAASQFLGKQEDNVFSRALDKSAEFRKAGLIPVFFCTDDYEILLVTTKERINKQYH